MDEVLRSTEGGLLLFTGAGISMSPPSSLPNWYEFNEAVLRGLADSVIDYTKRSLGEWVFERLLAKRNTTSVFAPDYIADVIAEEAGMDYFRIVQCLDAPETNASHRAIAALAASGRARAYVTTNFDRLVERALDAAGVPYEVFATPAAYARLAEGLTAGRRGPFPVVKAHGTVEEPESMVDTMSQRLVGRPEALEQALAILYQRHHVLFVGFSGADLDNDPNYLGLRGAAAANAGFTYLAYDIGKVRASITELREAWAGAGRVIEGRSPDWLVALCSRLGLAVAADPPPASGIDRLDEIRARARDWAATLGRLQTVNIAAALLRASGHDELAGRLYWGIWRHYRRPEDCQGVTYARFNTLIGRHLMEYGFNLASLRPPESARITLGDAPFDRDLMDNAFQYLARAVKMGWAPAGPGLALTQALMGSGNESLQLLERTITLAINERDLFLFTDACLAGGTIWAMHGVWTEGLERLELGIRAAQRLGNEPRRAELLAAAVRFMARKQRFDDAESAFKQGARIADRLGMEHTGHALRCAYGAMLTLRGRGGEAVPLQRAAFDHFVRSGRLAASTRAAIDLFDSAMFAGEGDTAEFAMSRLEEHERGYGPVIQMTFADHALMSGQHAAARSHAARAHQAATECQNEWVLMCCAEIEREAEKREREGG